MRDTGLKSDYSGSGSSGEQPAGRVRHLLNLAAALSRTAAAPDPSAESEATAGTCPTADSGSTLGSDSGPTLGSDSGSTPDSGSSNYGMPLGMDTGTLSDAQCINWVQDVESLLRWGQALAVQAAGEVEHRVAAGRFAETGARGAVGLLVQSLHISGREAAQRIQLAKQVLPIPDGITGQVAPAAHPVLGQAFFAGQLSLERAMAATKFLQEAQRLMGNGIISADTMAEVEDSLTTTASKAGPDFIRAVGNRILSHIDPDGNKPSESDLRAKQGLFFRNPRNGLVGIYGHCTVEQYEQIMAPIAHEANPNKHKDVNTINAEGDLGDHGEERADGGNGAEPDSLLDQLKGMSAFFQPATAGKENQPQPQAQPPRSPHEPELQPSRPPHDPEPAGEHFPASADQDAVHVVGQGWRRRLAECEIPPRPPEAPDNAIPPVHWGEKWFWFDSAAGPAGTWQDTDSGDFNIWAEPASATTPQPDSSAPPAPTHEPAAPHQPDHANGGFSPGWATGPLGSPLPAGPETGAPWPHLVDGVWVPAPGSDADMDGLDSTDPASSDPATKDTRTRAQKLLDGLIDCLKLAARTGRLPLNGGLRTQLIVATTEEDLRRNDRLGTAFTTYSGPMPLSLFDQSLCDPEVTRLVYGNGQEIINAGRTQRLFTPPQRKLLYARDLGCSFPDCTSPATWCEGHHIIPWQQGGPTDLSNGCLLCSHHHSLIHNSDWEVELVDGTPWFTPPWSVDRTRTPRRNRYHHGLSKE